MKKMIDGRQIIVDIHKEQGLGSIAIENIHGMPMIPEQDSEKFKEEMTEFLIFMIDKMNKGSEERCKDQ